MHIYSASAAAPFAAPLGPARPASRRATKREGRARCVNTMQVKHVYVYIYIYINIYIYIYIHTYILTNN